MRKGGVLFVDSADKAARFIWLCDAFNVPLLFLADVPGFMIGTQVERQGIIRHGAKMITAVSRGHGAEDLAWSCARRTAPGCTRCAGPAFEPDATLALPTASIAVMGPEAAVNAVYSNKIAGDRGPERARRVRRRAAREYEEDVDLVRLAAELVVDAVVEPDDLRAELVRRLRARRRQGAAVHRPPPRGASGMTPALPAFRSVLVANRGEIAVRVMRACRELGHRPVAVYSDPDAGALHVRDADGRCAIGRRAAAESYLDTTAMLAAAAEAGAEAVHPGYGLLSEHAGFARAVTGAGMTWVGPAARGDRPDGRQAGRPAGRAAAGVPAVPGTTDPVDRRRPRWSPSARPRLPGGGQGGRRRRRARASGRGRGPAEVADALASATREATRRLRRRRPATSSGSSPGPATSRSRCWPTPTATFVQLGERDCSVQRRHQKLVEEAPVARPAGRAAQRCATPRVAVAKACGYVGAGTVEFLWTRTGGAWFLEMNTRLQVEHPVTEQVTGSTSSPPSCGWRPASPSASPRTTWPCAGHAIECRVNAEDPARGFLPTPGTITALRWPGGPGVRVDAGYEAGDTVRSSTTTCWASWSPGPPTATGRSPGCGPPCDELAVEGVATTTPALARVLDHNDFRAARHWTTWLEETLDLGGLAPAAAPATEADFHVSAGGRTWPVRLYRHRPGSTGGGPAVAWWPRRWPGPWPR